VDRYIETYTAVRDLMHKMVTHEAGGDRTAIEGV
jgi:hypothetical protein